MAKDIEVAVLDLTSHSFPLSEQVELAQRFTKAGIRNWLTDQTFNWWPDGLLEPDLAPVVEQGWPKHTFWDRYVQAAWVSALVPGSAWAIAFDVIRRGPDTLAQMMMTLHEYTGGNVLFALAAGEVKQLGPYGYDEDKPFGKVDETIQVLQKLWTSDDPVTFDGKVLHLKNAYMGLRSSDGSLPPLTTIGHSPRLRKVTARYGAYVPVMGSIDVIKEQMREAREEAERVGRDPDEVKFWGTVFDRSRMAPSNAKYRAFGYEAETPEDEEIIRNSPLAKWATIGGWGGNPEVFGEEYHYSRDLVPSEWGRERVFSYLDKVPNDEIEFRFRTEDDIADTIVASAEAGIDLIRFSPRTAEINPGMRHRLTDMYIRATEKARDRLAAGATSG